MSWIFGVTGLLIGAALGAIIARVTAPQHKQQQMQKELDSAKLELEQQRQELTEHFSKTAELMDTLGKDYTKLFQHMANTSVELLPNLPDQDQPFVKKIAHIDTEPSQELNELDELNESSESSELGESNKQDGPNELGESNKQDEPSELGESSKQDEPNKLEIQIQPKDYAQGATGLLTPEEKEIIEAPDKVEETQK